MLLESSQSLGDFITSDPRKRRSNRKKDCLVQSIAEIKAILIGILELEARDYVQLIS